MIYDKSTEPKDIAMVISRALQKCPKRCVKGFVFGHRWRDRETGGGGNVGGERERVPGRTKVGVTDVGELPQSQIPSMRFVVSCLHFRQLDSMRLVAN